MWMMIAAIAKPGPCLARALVLVLLASGSGGWTTYLARGGDAPSDPRSASGADGSRIPADEFKRPASQTTAGRVDPSKAAGSASSIVATSSINGIPSVALAAYQRAETVINASDKTCHLPWQLIAAIGRVESDHGRYGGSTLGLDGVSRPGLVGIPLDGTGGTAEITDTDAGQLDKDTVHDRAVGPMQIIPSTWNVVGVDADADAMRNPQDIDDAALAAAVHLCSGPDDLGTMAGRRAAVRRYNQSDEYVDLVLSIMSRFQTGEHAAVPTYTVAAVTFASDRAAAAPKKGKRDKAPSEAAATTAGAGGGPAAAPASVPTPTTSPAPAPAPAKSDPLKQIGETLQGGITGAVAATGGVLTLTQATLTCTTSGYSPLLAPAAWSACLDAYTQ
jgi:hypothetical protein